MIAVGRELLVAQRQAGALTPALDLDTLAHVIIRVAESFLYSDLITGSQPDVAKAVEVVRVLLGASPARRGPAAGGRSQLAAARRPRSRAASKRSR